MGKLILLIAIFFLYAHPAQAALTFGAGTTDVANHGSATSIDQVTTATQLMWIYPTTLTSGRRLWEKHGSLGHFFALQGTTGDLTFVWNGTSLTQYTTTSTPLATLNKWYFVASTYTSATGVAQIYTGTLTSAAVESAYQTTTAGSGPSDDSAGSLWVGNADAADTQRVFQGSIGSFMMVNRVLTLGEIRSLQFNPRVVNGTLVFTMYGFNGTGKQPDWSGNGNAGTVTGATVSANVPLRSYRLRYR